MISVSGRINRHVHVRVCLGGYAAVRLCAGGGGRGFMGGLFALGHGCQVVLYCAVGRGCQVVLYCAVVVVVAVHRVFGWLSARVSLWLPPCSALVVRCLNHFYF